MEWLDYLDMEPNMFHREDHYWASIIAWLKRAVVKEPNAVKDEDSLIKFVKKDEKDSEQVMQERKAKPRRKDDGSKRFFGTLLTMSKLPNIKRKRIPKP